MDFLLLLVQVNVQKSLKKDLKNMTIPSYYNVKNFYSLPVTLKKQTSKTLFSKVSKNNSIFLMSWKNSFYIFMYDNKLELPSGHFEFSKLEYAIFVYNNIKDFYLNKDINYYYRFPMSSQQYFYFYLNKKWI